MVRRAQVISNPVLAETLLIKMPTGTVFYLTDDQNSELEKLCGIFAVYPEADAAATEGAKQLRAHYRRERSTWLKQQKLEAVKSTLGEIACELCGCNGTDRYPGTLGCRIFDVHHRRPLAAAGTPVRTTLDDLAVLCANCHRAVHSTRDVDHNYQALRSAFED